jgi:hypothetical protein
MADQPTTDPLQEARRLALLDAAGVLRAWLEDCGDIPIKHTSPQAWVRAGMADCIAEIEGMANGAEALPHD